MMSTNDALKKAQQVLEEGGVIGLPTETVYGLAARIDIPSAIEKIFTTKERPFFDPLIVHVSSIDMAKKVTAYWGPASQALAEVFWPGPLTLILPKDNSINSMITSGLESVGIRMPNHPIALGLIEEVGVPLAAPSANKFGRTSPTSATHVRVEFKNENVFVVDGGDCQIGIESTVLLVRHRPDKVELSILRRGHILKSDLEKVLKEKGFTFEFIEQVDKRESPGHMKHHYMPPIPLIVSTDSKRAVDDILKEVNQKLGQLPDEIESIKIIKPANGIAKAEVLKLSHDPLLATREFYGKLREVALKGADCIVFYKEPHQVGERWESLFDRLNKAASLIL
ncbi:L-threonylcarbamoyladenylate synthase [Bdellovibrio sp. SKB1291214]|uniref:L-threonylcarbamoyladenylate synthase n=1 Tax=Bdellovibrio sp. SKB1291214 TaxID=1732569 RepID=UPI000B516726|nr:L-threonylcarbamoyladenylate synthase [Bdellovibrio sp. SKB1291214]UYL10249.1 L-threonylcarbamoyladenylate synthase [Bdellovibrio sp. SKB1291214]